MLDTLAADRERLAEIQHQISDLEHTLAVLKLENSTIKQRLDAYQYPVLTLPNEIISEIFINVLPPYPECAPYLGLHSPLNLTHICRKWRQIALATPQLWCALLLGPADLRHDPQGVWLDRSGCCPLSIVVDDGYKTDQLRNREGEFLEAILPHRGRLEYLKLVTEDSVLPLIQGKWPLLRHLELGLGHPNLHLDFSDAPLLRSVRMHVKTVAAVAADSVELPWTQLTLLRVYSTYLDHCIPVLQRTTNIVRCELDLDVDWEADNFMVKSGASITLPHLESLRLSAGIDDESMTDCLSYFNLPVLSRLEVSEELLDPSPISSLQSLISRSSCKLEHVCIGGSRSVADDGYRTAFPSIIFAFTTPTADNVSGFWV